MALTRFSCSDLLQALFGPRNHPNAHASYVTQRARPPGDYMKISWTLAHMGWLPSERRHQEVKTR